MNKAEKVTLVNDVFNLIAPDYDRMNLIMTWGMLPLWQKKVMALTQLPLGGRAIDVCCGTGEMTFQLAKKAGAYGEAVGLDFSQEMIIAAQNKQALMKAHNVRFINGDALAIPLPNQSFHVATSGFALRNVADIPQAIGEMARVVKPGGRVVCMEVSRPLFPPARLFFNYYYYKLVPKLGDRMVTGRVVGDRFSPYSWLAESLKTFPNRRTICRYFKEAGLVDVQAKAVGFGAVTIYSGTKPSRDAALLPKTGLLTNVRKLLNEIKWF